VNVFLDNCLPPAWAVALHAIAQADGDRVVHLGDLFPRTVPDVEWLPRLAQREDGPYVIISGDERITRHPHERAAWRATGLTAFFLVDGWQNVRIWDKTWVFFRWWPQMRQIARTVRQGEGYRVPFRYGANRIRPL
jgi:hypothetical protein